MELAVLTLTPAADLLIGTVTLPLGQGGRLSSSKALAISRQTAEAA
jgi:hypothetical protein